MAKCQECGVEGGGHFTRCSNVSPEMRQFIADLDRDAASRDAREITAAERMEKANARAARDAIAELAADSIHSDYWRYLAERESEHVLARLRRLLR